MAYQTEQERRTDPYRAEHQEHPGARRRELGRGYASSRTGWIVGIVLLVILGLVVLGAMVGTGPGANDVPPAATAPAADPGAVPPVQETTPAPAPAPVE